MSPIDDALVHEPRSVASFAATDAPVSVDARAVPFEALLAVVPLLGFAVSSAFWLTQIVAVGAGVTAFAWGVVRLLRDRALSRVALVTVLAPLSFVASWVAACGITGLIQLLGVPAPPSPIGLLAASLGMFAAFAGVGAATGRAVARRGPGDARLFVHLSALPALLVLAVSSGWFGQVVWSRLTLAVWGLAVGRYLTGGPDVAERVGRRMRAWVSASLLVHVITAALLPSTEALVQVAGALTLTAPFLFVDRALEAPPVAGEPVPELAAD